MTIVGIVAVCWLSIWEEVKNLWYDEQIGSVYYFINVRKGIGAFFLVFTVLCVLPFSLCYYDDRRHGYFEYALRRTSLRSYCCSKMVVAVTGAFLAVMAGYIIAFGVLALRFPLITEGSAVNASYPDIVGAGHIILYFIFNFTSEAIGYAFLAAFTLMASVFIQNKFVIISVPMIFYYLYTAVCYLLNLPLLFYWQTLMSNTYFFYQLTDNGVLVWLLTLLYFGVLILFCSEGFYRGLKRIWYEDN